MAFLRDQGCDAMQGYLLSWPLPADQFTAFVDTTSRAPLPPDAAWRPAAKVVPFTG